MNPTSPEFSNETRPFFCIGNHDSKRHETLSNDDYGSILMSGFNFVTTPITNDFFRKRIAALVSGHLTKGDSEDVPIVTPLTTIDTTLFPSASASGMVGYASSWIDLCSKNPIIASVSRQILNLEISYANFVGLRSVIVAGPGVDNDTSGTSQAIAQYARAIHEALNVAARMNIVIHMPMYREPGLDDVTANLADLEAAKSSSKVDDGPAQVELFGAWDAWNQIRTASKYCNRLGVALRLPAILPEKDLQNRWFAEPLQYLTLGPKTFSRNKAGHPSLTKYHQELISKYMTLKNEPYLLLYDVGLESSGPLPNPAIELDATSTAVENSDCPTPQEAASMTTTAKSQVQPAVKQNSHVSYMRHVEMQQPPLSYLEVSALSNFQDYLQSPLQPLSDNLDSQTYEIFEKDPVKYIQYEKAITMALHEWSHQRKPTSSPRGAVVIAVVGSGRGPLVTRALNASAATGVAVEVWAIEKNPNAYVYLLRENETIWQDRVTVVRTDMRAWKGPVLNSEAVESEKAEPKYGKVDIMISELLGSFGDNELSPECLDGIQHVLAPHGISIPQSYTAHVTPISTPKIHTDISVKAAAGDKKAFNTPWVVRLFAHDYVVAKGVPYHPRFQRAWEFKHPLPPTAAQAIETKRGYGTAGGCGGAMVASAGLNDHNIRYCHLTFVCRARGVIHGLAGYFESTLYEKTIGIKKDPEDQEFDGDDDIIAEKVELSILPDQVDKKNKDMISWFPIFFPLKQPLYYPADTELEVSMWRQTDDSKVWYEWQIDAFTWVGTATRIKVGGSDLCTSRTVACMM
ncbi:hypothetical protein MKZ38_002323 [Zalerion maritima]|uniref:Protein arginine N-methyltransferase n=1 Tax=Zalerion maritima TaxID=339359 RepID=A0AAD5RZ98_9PEZI|nr:hypothetical protein MKZ38_002323 [Zalerion maritima]